ncbi:NYN domain-containing protein [Teichococcus wenyumeiae]|uniref:NYN domain-containing protein n=1 Tax=Teichococcus wenyumeiae TaxID=2478470 RepID=UPI0013157F65|nr:NYN domain-containing protein [Pseudoroseomonas wenyumeiae]
MERRTALFVDFDNIFGALCNLSPEAAEAFIAEPGVWLEWMARRVGVRSNEVPSSGEAPPRRILLRRCYLNPNGSLVLPSGERVFFGSFRSNLVLAGFQVTDCPPLTRGGKTSADMVLVMDVLDALGHATRFDEFVLMSSDADFTPVLQRLRAHDRRTSVVAIGNAAEAYQAAADEVIGSEDFLKGALGGLQAYSSAAQEQRSASSGTRKMTAGSSAQDGAVDPSEVREAILSAVLEELEQSPSPLHLGPLGNRLRARLGQQVLSTSYGGAGSLTRLLATAGDPRIQCISGGGAGGAWVYDPSRHKIEIKGLSPAEEGASL